MKPPKSPSTAPNIAHNSPLHSVKKPESDLEGAANLADRIYWITSHGRNREGEARESRHRFFATTYHVNASGRIELDFTGTGPQVPGDVNVVYLALVATVYYALKALLDPTIPANGGFYRAIRVTAPEGSIVNARPPAAVAWRTQTCQRIADVIFGALAPALPDAVIGATNGANSAWVFSGLDPRTGRYYVYLETIGGGSGARATKDGLDGVQVHGGCSSDARSPTRPTSTARFSSKAMTLNRAT